MVSGMVSSDGVNEGHVSHEPVLIDMTAKVHELVYQVDAGRCGNE